MRNKSPTITKTGLSNIYLQMLENVSKRQLKDTNSIIMQAPKEVEYAKCEDRSLLIVSNSEKLADYNS